MRLQLAALLATNRPAMTHNVWYRVVKCPFLASTMASPILVSHVSHPLAGKRALVTGGSRGIGAAVAQAFAAAGADVAISYSASPDKAAKVVAAITATGQKGFAIQADHAVQKEVTALVAKAAFQLGGLDILVNNAGVIIFGSPLVAQSGAAEHDATRQRLWEINVASVATAVRAAAPLLPKGGRIINIGSLFGTSVPTGGIADYAATKSALVRWHTDRSAFVSAHDALLAAATSNERPARQLMHRWCGVCALVTRSRTRRAGRAISLLRV